MGLWASIEQCRHRSPVAGSATEEEASLKESRARLEELLGF